MHCKRSKSKLLSLGYLLAPQTLPHTLSLHSCAPRGCKKIIAQVSGCYNMPGGLVAGAVHNRECLGGAGAPGAEGKS
jgi:hypothetical protein